MFTRLIPATLFGVVCTLIGDIFFKRSAGLAQPANLGWGILFYALGCLPIAYIFTQARFSEVFIIWEALTVIVGTTIGRLFFGDNIDVFGWAAVACALAALVLTRF